MEVFEITGYQSGISREGVNYLQPADSFEIIENGFIYRQTLKSRRGFSRFSTGRLSDGSRVMGIFEYVKSDNTSDLLAISQKFLYKWNNATDTFDQITNAGSAPAGGFGISSQEFYVSGVSWPDKSGADRFVFCSQGLTDIFFYNGTDVRSFTADNADYAAPAGGALTSPWLVLRFGERLNFWNPTIGVTPEPQGMLYSGIRDGSGNGDKFNVSGSGLLRADTSDFFQSALILGDIIVAYFSRSVWAVQKTRDAFNPYFIRKVPGVLGSDAPFSIVQWDDQARVMGRNGILVTDGRESKRVDNKIPFFTRDEVDPGDFAYSYGGFDRNNGQFLFSYKSNDADLDTQDRLLVNNYEENTWSVYDMRLTVFGEIYNGRDLTWDDIDENENPSWLQWDTTEEIWNKIGIGAATQKTLAGDDEGFIYQLDTDNDDYVTSISAISQASSAVLTVGSSAFKPGDEVVIWGVTGMTAINNFDPADPTAEFEPYLVTAATNTSVTINVNSTEFDAADPNTGTLAKIIKFRAKTIPFNPYRSTGNTVYVSKIELLLDKNPGRVYVDIISDDEDVPFISNVPLVRTSEEKDREWVSVSVNHEANFISFQIRQFTPTTQLSVTNMRIYAKPGGMTDA